MYCSNCGKESNKKTCGSCGVKQGKSSNFCKWCGSEIEEKASMCTNFHEKLKKNIFATIGLLALDLIFILAFLTNFLGNENVKSFILYPVLILGLVISLPIWRSIITKKTHDNRKIRKPVQIGRYVIAFVLFLMVVNVIIPAGEYKYALDTIGEDPIKAMNLFENMGDYKDAETKASEMADVIFNNGKNALDAGNWKEAEELFKNIPDHSGVAEVENELLYQKGVEFLNNHKYGVADSCFEKIGDYKNVNELKKGNVGLGLWGNDYNCTITSHSPLRVSSYSMYFRTVELEDEPPTVHIMVSHT
ncbi:MAG: zinc ribbon domain-containing protein, partial [Clostridia bacterium]|nr:zinc ribbon domain-containing protein [Clostridia bacterium]